MSLDNIYDHMAEKQFKEGKNTGALSRIFSYLSTFPIAYLVAYYINSEQYWIAGPFLLIGFTRYGHFAVIFIFIYSIYTEDWIALSSSLLFGTLGTVAAALGTKNAKKIMMGQKINVDPFEGTPDIALGSYIQIISFLLIIILSDIYLTISWIIFGISSFWVIGRYWFRLYPKWSRLYHPIMIRFSAYAGTEFAQVESSEENYNIHRVLRNLSEDIYPSMNQDDISLILKRASERNSSFADKEEINKMLKLEFKTVPDEISKIQESIEYSRQTNKNENSLPVRYFIAEVIENEYGAKERVKFLYDVYLDRTV